MGKKMKYGEFWAGVVELICSVALIGVTIWMIIVENDPIYYSFFVIAFFTTSIGLRNLVSGNKLRKKNKQGKEEES